MGEAKTTHDCDTCRYQGFSSGECPCSGCDGMGFDRWLPNETTEIAALKAELAKVTEELATAQEHIGQPLRLRVTLTKERDAARGDAEALAVALKAHGLGPCAFRPFDPRVDVCKTCDQQDTCVALVAHEENK